MTVDFAGLTIGSALVLSRSCAGWLVRCACGTELTRTHAALCAARQTGTKVRCDACAKKKRRFTAVL